MVSPASSNIALDAPAETLEELCRRLQRISSDAGVAPDIGTALTKLTTLRLLDQLPDFISIKDCESRFVFTNEAACRALAVADSDALCGKTDFDLFDRITAGRLFALEQRVIGSGISVEGEEERLLLHDGTAIWLSISKTALRNEAGQVVGLISISRDITERKRHEELRHGHARLLEMIARGQALDIVLDALVRLVETQLEDVRGSVMLLDDEGRHLTGAAAPNLPETYLKLVDGIEIGPSRGSCGTAAWRRSPVVVKDVLNDPLWDDFRELGITFGFRSCWSTPIIGAEVRVLGTFALYSSTVREPTDLELELMTMATDLAGIAVERAQNERRIRHMAHHDPLTGLANRALFWSQFSRTLHEARREGRKVTVAYVDLDNFKSINDTFGHAAGDEVLRTLAMRMSQCVRASDLLVRLGGDEFAIVFSNASHNEQGVLRRLDALRQSISRPVEVEGGRVTATCSMGVAFFPDDGDVPEALLARADRAMYEAKGLGRDRMRVSL